MRTWLHRLRSFPQLIQFALVGGAAAATHLAVVATLVSSANTPPLIANIFAFLVAFIVSYNGHAYFTFADSQTREWTVMGKFFIVACTSFVFNEALYYVLLNWFGWQYLWSLAFVLVVVAAGTFVMSKFWAFRTHASK